MTRVTGRRAAESAAGDEFEDCPDTDWTAENEANNTHKTISLKERMAPPSSWGPLIPDRTQPGRVLARRCGPAGVRHRNEDVCSHGCRPASLRWPAGSNRRIVR